MNVTPIQILNEGVLIPLHYLNNAHEFVFEVQNGNVLVRPKPLNVTPPDDTESQDEGKESYEALLAQVRERFPWAGMLELSEPDLSERVEEILMEEIDPRSGWTMKERLGDAE